MLWVWRTLPPMVVIVIVEQDLVDKPTLIITIDGGPRDIHVIEHQNTAAPEVFGMYCLARMVRKSAWHVQLNVRNVTFGRHLLD